MDVNIESDEKALFFLQGQASNQLIVKQAEKLPEPSFLHMELSFTQLNDYLLNFQKIVNQHAFMLNRLQSEVGLKIEKQNISPCFKKISDNFLLTPGKFKMDMERGISKCDTNS